MTSKPSGYGPPFLYGRPKDPAGQVAVALSYEKGTDPAPRVVASGRGMVAEQILQLAFANGIKVREDADLAELLATVELDTVIPLEAFAAVAEIIAYLYRANAIERGDGGSEHWLRTGAPDAPPEAAADAATDAPVPKEAREAREAREAGLDAQAATDMQTDQETIQAGAPNQTEAPTKAPGAASPTTPSRKDPRMED